jgi:hypothetical protein
VNPAVYPLCAKSVDKAFIAQAQRRRGSLTKVSDARGAAYFLGVPAVKSLLPVAMVLPPTRWDLNEVQQKVSAELAAGISRRLCVSAVENLFFQ